MMRVFFVLDETVFYQPQMLDHILKKSNQHHVGIAINTKDILAKYMIKHLFDIGIIPAAKLAAVKYLRKLYSLLLTPVTRHPMTVKDVALKHKLPHFEVSGDINQPFYLDKIRNLKPDVIVSSNCQIFHDKLLGIPTIACINRHSALLPSYGGILPVFQAIIHHESQVGVTIHYMDKGIDTGDVITQQAFPIGPGQTMAQIYRHCFDMSAQLIIDALDIIEKKLPPRIIGPMKPSYFSFPSLEDWNEFKKSGRCFA
jgi:methionyl-tRNA formyltransferase